VSQASTLRIQIALSVDTNDHEVKLLVDGNDVFRRLQGMGLDPDDCALPAALMPAATPRTTIIGRCDCGVRGCGDIDVRISLEEERIVWELAGEQFCFVAADYIAELERAGSDLSWETPDRSAGRLVRCGIEQVRTQLADHGLTFHWASGRVQAGSFTASIESAQESQILIHIPWTDESPEQIAAQLLVRLAALRG